MTGLPGALTPTVSSPWWRKLRDFDACPEAVEWAKQYPTFREAWNACPRGDWMLWLLSNLDRSVPWSEARKPIVRVALACAKEALPYTTDVRVAACLQTVAGWLHDCATKDDLEKASVAAWYAARSALNNRESAAAHAAESAESAARSIVWETAHMAARSAARSFASAVGAICVIGATGVAERGMFLCCADHVRQEFPQPPVLGKQL